MAWVSEVTKDWIPDCLKRAAGVEDGDGVASSDGYSTGDSSPDRESEEKMKRRTISFWWTTPCKRKEKMAAVGMKG
ncbi:hypothetical protein Hanom_Chr02g00156491 [Helianthus anomalus]